MATIKGKPGVRRIPSDDCSYTQGGDTYHAHVGETVWMLPGMTVGEYEAVSALGEIGTVLAAAEGEADEASQVSRARRENYARLCRAIAPRIVHWDWTDVRGKPLPQVDGDPEVLKRLHAGELYWLLTAAEGETATEEKKGWSPSTSTSSASTPPASPPSSNTGRSRTRR